MTKRIKNIIKKELPGIDFGFCSLTSLPQNKNSRLKSEGFFGALVFVFPYKVKEKPPENISRYCAVPDYHNVAMIKLKKIAAKLKEEIPEENFSPFTDISPIGEVYAAVYAGLGVKGENGLLITKKYGSFVFIGEILTSIRLKDACEFKECPKCGMCKNHCPVGLDKSRCLSSLTQKKGNLSLSEQEKIKNLGSVFGCDICQSVCPLNKNAANTNIDEFLDGYRDQYQKDEDDKNRAYTWRGRAVVDRNLDILSTKKTT